MASADRQRSDADLVPLRVMAEKLGASSEDRLLADGLTALYPEAPMNPASGWERLQAEALQIARQRRRRYLLKELFSNLVPRPMRLLAASLLVVLFLSPGDKADSTLQSQAELVDAPHTAIAGESRSARLLAGAELLVQQGSIEVEQEDRSETRILLTAGAVRLQVPPLPGRGRLVVITSDADVIVHGTRFTVRKADAESTTVTVDEGLVEVRPNGGGRAPVFLRPGEEINVPGLARYRGQIAARAQQLIAEGRCEDPDGNVDKYLELTEEGTDLSAAQYLKGFCAAQQRNAELAIRWFERAAGSSQDMVRADNALARAAKLRAEHSEADGLAAWRRYLERFPTGLHHKSAERFLTRQP
jgi:hypothetical protein